VPIEDVAGAMKEENLDAAAIQLTPDELDEIDAATSGIEVRGARGTGREQYP